jgi:hypothetical protein
MSEKRDRFVRRAGSILVRIDLVRPNRSMRAKQVPVSTCRSPQVIHKIPGLDFAQVNTDHTTPLSGRSGGLE